MRPRKGRNRRRAFDDMLAILLDGPPGVSRSQATRRGDLGLTLVVFALSGGFRQVAQTPGRSWLDGGPHRLDVS